MTRVVQSFHRPERKICRCAASWPSIATCVKITASAAAVNSCHQVSPIRTKAARAAPKTTGRAISWVQ